MISREKMGWDRFFVWGLPKLVDGSHRTPDTSSIFTDVSSVDVLVGVSTEFTEIRSFQVPKSCVLFIQVPVSEGRSEDLSKKVETTDVWGTLDK